MATPEIQSTTIATPQAAAPAADQATGGHGHGFNFHEFLSAINPLQYLPVVGTIYRAMTGDVIPESLREGGSMLVSGLLGGPIGVVTYIVTTLAEKITGIDPEKIAAAELSPTSTPAVARTGSHIANPPTVKPVAPATVQRPPPSPVTALTPDQLAAYGVRKDASGTLKLGDIKGADALNGVELIRLAQVAATYAASQARSSGLKPT